MSTAPTPLAVDELALRRDALIQEIKDELERATKANEPRKAELEKLDATLLGLVADHGSAHAEKSKLLHGAAWEVMASYGSSVSYDAAAIERFRLALGEAKQTGLLRKLFDKAVRWSLKPNSAVIVKGEKMKPTLLALYSQCEVVTAKKPMLTVRPKKS